MDANIQQQQAIAAPDGPVAIIAGPGTGKTRTLVARLQTLIDRGERANQLLALTFTKKSAEQMAARFAATSANQPRISTFHALCFDLLTQKRGQPPAFITEVARLALIKKLPRPAALKTLTVRELGLLISRAKNGAEQDTALHKLVEVYNDALSKLALSDFDDLLLQTRDLLKSDSAWRQSLQKKFTHILVDEFQDTNALQYEILNLLRGNDNLFVIGDPLQSIYGFRGAAGDIFTTFAQDFPQALTVALTTNYRSAGAVVRLANALYPLAPALVAHGKTPGRVAAHEVLNEYSEAAWILQAIQQAIGGSDFQRAVSNDHRADHVNLGDMAVLYRSRSAARVLQQQFEASGIPFQVVGEGSPYETPAIQTIVQLFGHTLDPARPVSATQLTPGQIEHVSQSFGPADNPHAVAVRLADQFGFNLTSALRQFLGSLIRFKTIAAASAYFDSIAASGFYDPRADAVTLLTIHAAKGLEFTRVFLIGAEDGLLPSAKGELPEEKRLFYVAVTRAKQQLDITYAHTRGGKPAKTSPFILAVDSKILPRHRDAAFQTDLIRSRKRQAKRAQSTLF